MLASNNRFNKSVMHDKHLPIVLNRFPSDTPMNPLLAISSCEYACTLVLRLHAGGRLSDNIASACKELEVRLLDVRSSKASDAKNSQDQTKYILALHART